MLAQSRMLADCEPPETLDGCAEIGRVRVADVALSSPTCYVDARVHAHEIGRILRCPTGSVIAFRGATFSGRVDGQNVDVCFKTQFPFADGCTWQTMQRIRGTGVLQFTYSEHPVAGAGCTPSSCTARADLELVR